MAKQDRLAGADFSERERAQRAAVKGQPVAKARGASSRSGTAAHEGARAGRGGFPTSVTENRTQPWRGESSWVHPSGHFRVSV